MQKLLNQLEVLTQMMREYAERHNYKYVSIKHLSIEGEGYFSCSIGLFASKNVSFNSLPELIDKLKQ